MNIEVLINAWCSSARHSDNIKQLGCSGSTAATQVSAIGSSFHLVVTGFSLSTFCSMFWWGRHRCSSLKEMVWIRSHMHQRILKKALLQLVGWCKVQMNHLKAASYFSAVVNREYWNGLRCLKWCTLLNCDCLVKWSHRPNAFAAGEKGCGKGNSTCSKWID